MLQRIKHLDPTPCRMTEAEKYLHRHEKHMDFMYGPFLKDLRRFDIKGKCLEIGAGPGLFSSMFVEEFPDTHLTVSDASSAMLDLARQTFAKNGIHNRADFCLFDAGDERALKRLGKFDVVYSLYSMHHWQDLEKCLENLINAVNDGGILYLGDLKRVWWLCYLPGSNHDLQEIRSAFRPAEVEQIIKNLGIVNFKIQTLFPFFLQSAVLWH
jgi:2-polyprenyl-3-methyl-5-hydroxy-6-metoxy-1,4-benzoquinol methylase